VLISVIPRFTSAIKIQFIPVEEQTLCTTAVFITDALHLFEIIGVIVSKPSSLGVGIKHSLQYAPNDSILGTDTPSEQVANLHLNV